MSSAWLYTTRNKPLGIPVPETPQPALLIDLDHTLIRPKSGDTFPRDMDDWEFMPGALDKLKMCGNQIPIIIISNQGGIEAGYHTEQEIKQKFANILRAMLCYLDPGMTIQPIIGYYFCPSINKDDPMRKPNPGMIFAAQQDFNLDLAKCMMVGDMDSDRACAINAGVGYYNDVKQFLAPHD